MCVAIVVDKQRVESSILTECYHSNPDGAGIAWIQGNKVHWRKGLDLDNVIDIANRVPLPQVVHFRLATVGGATPRLTHPFPLESWPRTKTAGKTQTGVLVHNGHWPDWHKWYKALRYRRIGRWSDTRVLAGAFHKYGKGLLDVILPDVGKVAVLDPLGVQTFGTWHRQDGAMFSNLHWSYSFDTWCGYQSPAAGYSSSIPRSLGQPYKPRWRHVEVQCQMCHMWTPDEEMSDCGRYCADCDAWVDYWQNQVDDTQTQDLTVRDADHAVH